MKKLLTLPLLAALTAYVPAPAHAGSDNGSYSTVVEGSFEDIAFGIEQAIINEGLVIDLRSHVGDMLNRTKGDVGGEAELFLHADVFSFCSATLSRAAMEADLTNLQFCPYGIFVYEAADAPGEVTVGHRLYPGDSMAPVNELLTRLVDTAVE